MSAAPLARPAKWEAKEYRRMVSASHRDGKLIVLFADGTWVDVRADRVVPPETQGAQWERLSVSPYEITVPTDGGEVEIPWSTVRAVTDKEYSAHLADAAEEEARQIGLRIRALRESRNLTSKELRNLSIGMRHVSHEFSVSPPVLMWCWLLLGAGG